LDKQTANYKKSVADHLEAGRLDPHDAEYRQSLCKARSSQGVREWKYDSDTALACYTTAIETGPANNAAAAAAYSGRASVYSERGEYDKAIADLTESIRIQGMNGENPAGTYLVRGHAHDDAKDYARARVDYEKAAELEPDGCWGSKARENLERLRKAGR
jgi:tetratricopeptide (TPR) repeat protein